MIRDKFIDLFLVLETKDERTLEQLKDEFDRVNELIVKIEDLKSACRRGTSERDRYAGTVKNLKKKVRRLETLMSRLSETPRQRRLTEGGLAGHLSHLYENWDLTFNDIMEVFRLSAEGELEEVTEKVDGMNLFISWDMEQGVLKAARNNTHIKQGGLDAEGLASKFAGRGPVHDAFVNGFNVLEDAIGNFDPSTKRDIFGPNADIWYSIEAMFTDAPNTIVYDRNNIVFHIAGSSRFDKETGKPTDDDITKQFNTLSNAVKDIQNKLNKESWSIVTPAFMNLQKLADDSHLNKAISLLNKLMAEYGLNNSDSLGFYIKTRLHVDVMNSLRLAQSTSEDMKLKEEVVNKIMGEKGSRNIREIMKSISDESVAKQVKEMVDNSKSYLDECVQPLEEIIRDFSVEVLRGLKSSFMIDDDKEVKRLQKEVQTAIDVISTSGYEEAIDILKKQMKRLKSVEDISSAMEGIVFRYKGHTYKYTGSFAVANQILGLFKFGRGKVPPLNAVLNKTNENI